MLPFLKPKQAGSVMSIKYDEKKGQESEGMEGEHSPGIMSAAEDLISAIHAKDSKGVADALKAYDEISDSLFDNPAESED